MSAQDIKEEIADINTRIAKMRAKKKMTRLDKSTAYRLVRRLDELGLQLKIMDYHP
jgi:ribosomal protein L29